MLQFFAEIKEIHKSVQKSMILFFRSVAYCWYQRQCGCIDSWHVCQLFSSCWCSHSCFSLPLAKVTAARRQLHRLTGTTPYSTPAVFAVKASTLTGVHPLLLLSRLLQLTACKSHSCRNTAAPPDRYYSIQHNSCFCCQSFDFYRSIYAVIAVKAASANRLQKSQLSEYSCLTDRYYFI